MKLKTRDILGILLFLLVAFPAAVKAAEEKLEVEAITEIKKSAYVGEVLEYTVTIKSNTPNLGGVRVAAYPQIEGDAKILRGVANNQRPKEISEKGKKYYLIPAIREFVIPEKEGKYSISAGKFVVYIPQERIIQDPFWGMRRYMEYEERLVDSKKVGFKADLLPANKTGVEFSGCIGEFSIEGWFPPGQIRVGGDAIAVFTISGFGSLENLKVPNLYKLFSDGCTLKEVEQSEQQSQRDGRLFSEITLTCRFTADAPDFKISPLKILVFNPSTKKYEEISSESLHWTGVETPTKSKSNHSRDAIEI